LLLFGMMILVAILSETGIFDFLAVYAYKVKTYNMIVIIIYVLFVQVIR
jgi:Na+/H+ antiporter NhaD/arsenite permease-like protein